MPTYSRTNRFQREYLQLSQEERKLVKAALRQFIRALGEWERGGRQGNPVFPAALRVKKMAGHNCWEMTWHGDGRATWKFGAPDLPRVARVDWYRIGGHEIFDDPLG